MRRRIRAWLARFAAEAATLDQPLQINRTTMQVGGRTLLLTGMSSSPDILELQFRDKDRWIAAHTVCRDCKSGLHTMDVPHD